MPRFRKLPVEVEAYEFHNGVGEDTRPAWLLDAVKAGTVRFFQPRQAPGFLIIETLEGAISAHPGDFIIQGVAGEIYPCRADIFAATYEPVEPVWTNGSSVRFTEGKPVTLGGWEA